MTNFCGHQGLYSISAWCSPSYTR